MVVEVNYRLGPLGMLHVPGVARGDMLLQDIEAALDWVRSNITGFGGNPGCITLMGQSAGAHAIMCLLCRGSGGFHRAVLLSPPPARAPLSEVEATERGRQFVAELGADPREAPVQRMLEAQGRMLRAMARFGEILVPFLPKVDGVNTEAEFIERTAQAAAGGGIELIIGTTRDEMMAFFAIDPAMQDPEPDAVAACFARLAGTGDAIEVYRRRRPGAVWLGWCPTWGRITCSARLPYGWRMRSPEARAGVHVPLRLGTVPVRGVPLHRAAVRVRHGRELGGADAVRWRTRRNAGAVGAGA